MSDQHQQLNPDGEQEKKSMNRAERRAEKHRETIQSFSFQNESQCRTGYVDSADRSATDVCFLGVFMITVLAMIGLSAYGFMNGNAALLLAPTDASGKTCGNKADPMYVDYPYLYFADLEADDISKVAICVSECPKTAGADVSCRTAGSVTACGKAQYGSENVLEICVPNDADEFKPKFEAQMQKLVNKA